MRPVNVQSLPPISRTNFLRGFSDLGLRHPRSNIYSTKTWVAAATAAVASLAAQPQVARTQEVQGNSTWRVTLARLLRKMVEAEDPDAFVARACGAEASNSGVQAMTSTDLEGIARYIKSGACRSVVVLTGAGVSTGAGIPDFRSPGGMYDTLRPEVITATEAQRAKMRADPTWVVMKPMFFANQFPYLEVRRPFILGTEEQQWKATLSHWFMKFLADEGVLTRVFTQNIDGLDYQTGIPEELVCNVHGSLGQITCESCGTRVAFPYFCNEIRMKIKDIYGVDEAAPKESSNICCPNCGRPHLKPSTVLFGGALPREFFDLSAQDLPSADLLIVAGTSLVVSPANSVVEMVGSDCPRLVVNREPVGQDLGIMYGPAASRDIFVGESCDEVFLRLIQLLDWQDKVHAIKDKLPDNNRALVAKL